jgi:hypothetical protein
MMEPAQSIRVGKMVCAATGRPVAQDHAEGPQGNLTDFPGALIADTAACLRLIDQSGRCLDRPGGLTLLLGKAAYRYPSLRQISAIGTLLP